MNRIQLKARAKINLALDVLGRRADGYHDVKMIMQTVNLYDKIDIKKIKKPEIIIKTNLPYIPTDENNLAYKAAKLILDNYGIKTGVFIRLFKVIPVAAGLAGGSSDAAAVLIGLNKLYDLNLSIDELMALGVTIGADVPFCLLRGTALAEGIGEKLTTLAPMPDCFVLLAKPNINVSTAQVYEELEAEHIQSHPNIEAMIDAIEKDNLKEVAHLMGNVLESVTIKRYPVIEEIKALMLENGAVGAMMSGSGPTVFGLYEDENLAKAMAYELKVGELARQVYVTSIFNRKR